MVWSIGQKITAAALNGLENRVIAAESPPACKGYQSGSGQVVVNTTQFTVTLNAEAYDDGTNAMHDLSTNNSRIYARVAGLYIIEGSIGFGSNATGYRNALLILNSGSAIGRLQVAASPTANVTVAQVQAFYRANVGDYFELAGVQTSGGSLTLSTGVDYTWLNVTKLGA